MKEGLTAMLSVLGMCIFSTITFLICASIIGAMIGTVGAIAYWVFKAIAG